MKYGCMIFSILILNFVSGDGFFQKKPKFQICAEFLRILPFRTTIPPHNFDVPESLFSALIDVLRQHKVTRVTLIQVNCVILILTMLF